MFQNITSVEKFAHLSKLNGLWNLKKNGLTLPPPPKATTDAQKEKNISSISNKLTSGKRLTPEEMRYLQEYAPELYRKAQEADAARIAYESAVKGCKTKEDVQKVQSSSMTASMATEKSDPEGAQIKAAAVSDAHAAFVSSSAYNKLDTEAKRNERLDKKGSSENNDNTVKTKTNQERHEFMQEMMDPDQKMQYTLRNYNAQEEKRVNGEAAVNGEPKPSAVPTEQNDERVFHNSQNSPESTKAYMQSKGMNVETPSDNHVSFSSLTNASNAANASANAEAAVSAEKPSKEPAGAAVLGRAHAAYQTAKISVVSEKTEAPLKSGLRAKA